MVLGCGGLAGRETAYDCARLEDAGDAYRLLDLGRYPEGYVVRWAWEDDGPAGEIAGPGWTLALAQLGAVCARYLDVGAAMLGGPAGDAAVVRGECQVGVEAMLGQLPC